jgi:hypothetical protein
MNQQRYGRSPVPRRAGLSTTYSNQGYSGDVPADTDEYNEYDDDVYEDDVLPSLMPRSAIRYTTTQEAAPVIVSGNRRYVLHNRLPQPPQQSIPQPRPPSRPQPQLQPQVRRAAPPPQYDDEEEDEPPTRQLPRSRRRVHPMFILGLGMALMLSLWILGNMALHWWQVTQDDWHYGRPRTFQMDAVVGHNHDSLQSPSHFVAMNYHSHIQIIEFPGGDTTRARLYQGPALYGDEQDLAVVTLAFKDINGDGKPEMIVIVGATHIAFINDGTQFRLLKPGEQVAPY